MPEAVNIQQTPADDSCHRVLIADDHRLIAEAVARLLTNNGYHVTIVETLGEVLSSLALRKPDIVLLDLKMSGMQGLVSINKVVAASSPGKVIIFSGTADDHLVNGAVQLGVKGYIPKTMPLKSLESVLNLVSSGQVFVPPNPNSKQASLSDEEILNAKEKSILVQVAEGKTNKEIAIDVNSNEMMIKMQMRAICKKLNAKNRTQAVMKARELLLL